jgi:hypothetical protein
VIDGELIEEIVEKIIDKKMQPSNKENKFLKTLLDIFKPEVERDFLYQDFHRH